MRRLLGPVLLAALVAASLWFMQSRGPAPAPVAPSSSTTSSTSPPPGPAQPVPSPVTATAPPRAASSTTPPTTAAAATPGDGAGTPVPPSAAVTARTPAQAALFARYQKAAAAFMTAFARPPAEASERWWATVRPHLSDQAAEAYSGTDPQLVPFTRVTGPATIIPTDAPTGLLVAVRIPTDAGSYRVELQTGPEGIRVTRAIPEQTGANR